MQTRLLLKPLKSSVAVCLLAGIATVAAASERGSKDEAMAMTKKAIAALKGDKDKAVADINAGGWKDRDLYPMIYTAKMVNVAHGANAKLVGKDLSELKDADGKLIVKCLIDAAERSAGKGGWCDYKWPNPVTKEVEAKSTYVEKSGELYVGVGIYK